MRIIGEISHPKYKITLLKMNAKVTIQIENRLVSQSYVFRDGSGISDQNSAEKFLTQEFMESVDQRFEQMNKDYISTLEQINKNELDDFEII
ncbi:MAG: hypothetical protein AAGA77_19660 [Bacteroidota bacterium]